MNRAQDLFQRVLREGEKAIDEFIADRISEELFLDFKASPDNGAGAKLAHSDREKLAKAISGFGNSEGGVIVWGVDCDRLSNDGDVARAKRPIQNPTRFKGWLEGAVSGCTLPPHEGVEHRVIRAASENDEGFLVTLIPKSMRAPHQCIVDPHRHRYYMRVGSNFDHVPHGVLAGMFGSRPQPYIFHMWNSYGGGLTTSRAGVIGTDPTPENTPCCYVGFVLRNDGMSIARDLYVNIEFGMPGPACTSRVLLSANVVPQDPWVCHSSYENVYHLVSDDGFKLAPGAMVEPIRIELAVRPPFDTEFSYKISYGCTGTAVNLIAGSAQPEAVQDAYGSFMASDHSKSAARTMARTLFGFSSELITERDTGE